MSEKINRNKNNYSIKIVLLVFAIFIMLILNIILSKIAKTSDNNVNLSNYNISEIKKIIEYYKCEYISENQSTEKDFNLDIYLEFCKLPYDENNNSNEEFYNSVINDIAKIINYKNYRLIDEKNQINIKVTCKNRSVELILINDIEDYFIYMNSQLSMKNYKELKTTNFEITSEILQAVINEEWEKNFYFGERDSIYNEYYIYFNQGIKVRTIKDKIYNIVFDKKYSGNVINNLFPGIGFNEINSNLGAPAFEDEQNNIIGYKGREIYVFFSKDEISVYRISNDNADDFFKLADEYINSSIDLLEFMNKLTYMWPDYSKYEYSSTSVYLSYPLKGIEIKINYDDMNGILVYNNIRSSMSKIQRYLENTNFVARLQLDAVFETEIKRINEINTEKQYVDEYIKSIEETETIIGESLKYSFYPEVDERGNIYKMRFISKRGEEPNRELNDSINSYLWASNDIFIYSKKEKGIYLYNLEEGKVSRILEGSNEFQLKEYKDGILYYDNKEVKL